ncbi:MAG: NAD-dependent epimerase/dehydratase family protein [Chloroflexi bacterium]|nr:NAD-dependent epimerase/dehydratase family protein [Chloroflexota bacterium]MBP8054393.1 NAD-dependent epimerase/dehydratase family protein [Chloroflexota bacterium]
MKAFVTGSNGFIGYNLCQTLQTQGYEVMGLDDLSSGLAENSIATFRYERGKVQDKERVVALLRDFQPDVVFHLAAIPRVSYSVEQPFASAEANLLGTISLLEGLVKAELVGKTRLVNTSSSSIYGGVDQFPTPENYPGQPQSPYALEKYQAEEWCRLFANLYGLDVVSLRYFNVFGPHALFGGAYSTVLSAWLYHLYVDPTYEPFLEGDGTQTRDFCYVDNVVQANMLAVTRERRFVGEAFNIAQGRSYSLLECRDMLEELSGRKLNLVLRPPRVGDVKHTLADISAAQRELGYEPSVDFISQLMTMAEWYRLSYPKRSILP